MYVEIKENKLLSWCEKPYLDYEYVDIDCSTFEPEKYSIVEGVLKDISVASEFQDNIIKKEKDLLRADLLAQVEELDKKRIRAIAEPALKDAEIGQTWLEYYTLQIQALRSQMEG